MVLREQIDAYLQHLLAAQYSVSHIIEHRLTKGELREKFIQRIISEEYPNLMIRRGIIVCDDWQSPQTDLIWLKSNARIGDHDIYDIDDVNLTMEIKSNAKTAEINQANNTAKVIKEKCPANLDIKVGMFCYCSHAMRETIIPKFGFSYDRKLASYDDYEVNLDLYPHMDFFFSLDITHEQTPYFVYRGNERQDDNDPRPIKKNLLFLRNPVIHDFLRMFR